MRQSARFRYNNMEKVIVFLNGKFILPEKAKISIFDPGFLYGWGLFETMRSRSNKIVYLSQHMDRIKNSCGLVKMRLPYPADKLKAVIKKAVKLCGAKDAYVRLTLWKSEPKTGILLVVRRYKFYSSRKYKQGFRACVSRFRQNEGSLLARLKSANYLLCGLSFREAQDRDFDEAIILNNRGYIAEASRSNIFLVKDRRLFTPSLDCGCLNGITRKVIFDLAKKYNILIEEGNFTLYDLFKADEAFLTNSLLGVMPLVSVEHKAIGSRKTGRTLTDFFFQKYNFLSSAA